MLFRNHSLRAYPGGLARYEQVEKDDALARPAKPCDACILMTRIHECTCSWKRRRDNTPHVVRSIVSCCHYHVCIWRARSVTSPADSSVFNPPLALPSFLSSRINTATWIHYTPKSCPRIPRGQYFFKQSRGRMHSPLRNRLTRSHSSTVSAVGCTSQLGRCPFILNPG